MSQWLPGWTTTPPSPNDGILALIGESVLRREDEWLIPWSEAQAALTPGSEPIYVGRWNRRAVYVAELASLTPAAEPVPLRDALLFEAAVPAELLSTAFQVLQWWRDHRFCGRCGQETGPHPRERARWCDRCEIPWYPRLAPCVIVVIRRGDRMLLARSSRVKRHFYSLIAGFVEPGETVEAAVQREVREETGLEVTAIRYQTSQPWPFPHQLMLGFFADYAGGELRLQEDELADAGWYRPGELPPVPPKTTIAGRLIRAMEEELDA
ncbi:NAD(+) diphosphatase [Marinobacter sp. SS21]|uniref:NAD(+) diphosphatase n=1 Tax=Marinobacter sp. SS21 TaxID=2979460 RepID=UPI00232CB545|nr:NAD(+) diphosphatase [Marinobacter sp. SS21]MDC0662650.1 NAD(+) diphosphatase [Marinobacter sp. SS21]